MAIEIRRAPVDEIMPLRELYRQEMNCQIVHDAYAARGFSEAYLILAAGRIAGYGLVGRQHETDTVHEFHTLSPHRSEALAIFRQLLEVSQARRIRAQTNDRLMLLMLYDCGTAITGDTILFEDALSTHLTCPTGNLRRVAEADRPQIFEHTAEPVGDWMIESDGAAVATGGALFHYNPPYGDIFMEVHEPHRRRGFGSYLVHELKRICYEMGKIPAARCGVANVASRKTLEKAGLLPCARILRGDVVR